MSVVQKHLDQISIFLGQLKALHETIALRLRTTPADIAAFYSEPQERSALLSSKASTELTAMLKTTELQQDAVAALHDQYTAAIQQAAAQPLANLRSTIAVSQRLHHLARTAPALEHLVARLPVFVPINTATTTGFLHNALISFSPS